MPFGVTDACAIPMRCRTLATKRKPPLMSRCFEATTLTAPRISGRFALLSNARMSVRRGGCLSERQALGGGSNGLSTWSAGRDVESIAGGADFD